MYQPKELNTLKGKLNAVKRSKKSRHFKVNKHTHTCTYTCTLFEQRRPSSLISHKKPIPRIDQSGSKSILNPSPQKLSG